MDGRKGRGRKKKGTKRKERGKVAGNEKNDCKIVNEGDINKR